MLLGGPGVLILMFLPFVLIRPFIARVCAFYFLVLINPTRPLAAVSSEPLAVARETAYQDLCPLVQCPVTTTPTTDDEMKSIAHQTTHDPVRCMHGAP
jgi:hypothetical protein